MFLPSAETAGLPMICASPPLHNCVAAAPATFQMLSPEPDAATYNRKLGPNRGANPLPVPTLMRVGADSVSEAPAMLMRQRVRSGADAVAITRRPSAPERTLWRMS